jgi:hypothetical protein
MRVALVNAPLRSAVCDLGVGHQMPLGLLMAGGALEGRCTLTLIDAARDHLPKARSPAASEAVASGPRGVR